jgi:hypothetical protein
MNKQERQEFIERMEEIGDVWEDDDVKRVYGEKTFDEALSDRMTDMNAFANIIGTIINR